MTTIGIISKHKPRTENILNKFILSRGITDISVGHAGLSVPPQPYDIYIIEDAVKKLSKILNANKGIIITADEFLMTPEPDIPEAYIINCSLSMRSTITASSIEDGGFNYCIQREFSDINKNTHQPQEFGILFGGKPEDIYLYLASVTALIVCGIPGDKLRDFTF